MWGIDEIWATAESDTFVLGLTSIKKWTFFKDTILYVLKSGL
jgi:hypothetical protein